MNATDYTVTRDPETGLMVVRYRGIRVGQTQTQTGANLIRRNHRRRLENESNRDHTGLSQWEINEQHAW